MNKLSKTNKLIKMNHFFGSYGYNCDKNYVLFYGSRGEDLFGNFYKLKKKIYFNDIEADNIETLYHSSKFLDSKIKKQFENLSGIQSFYLSRKYKSFIRKDWINIKDDIMYQLIKIKFKIPEYAIVLMLTGNKFLVEHNPVVGRDVYWSNNHNDSGQNKLGYLLMKYRGLISDFGIVEKPCDYISFIKSIN